MRNKLYPIRLGLQRGLIEIKQLLTNPQELGFNLFLVGVFMTVLFFQRGTVVEGTDISLATMTLPSLVGMLIAFGGFMGVASSLAYEREDGTLLRAKATPKGMVAYVVSKIVSISAYTVSNIILLLIPGLFLASNYINSIGDWLMLLAILVLGLLATLPWGAIVGSLVKNAASGFNMTMLPISILAAISGIFYPITALAGWIQVIAQLFPLYWLGHGVRMAFLPDAAAVAEIGGVWRPVETLVVLGIWAIAGLILAPRILRKMARHESGSLLEERKKNALSRGY